MLIYLASGTRKIMGTFDIPWPQKNEHTHTHKKVLNRNKEKRIHGCSSDFESHFRGNSKITKK